MASRSLTQQFKYAVSQCFHPGSDKHAMKSPNQYGKPVLNSTHIVFSYQSRKSLTELACQAARFMKIKHPDIKKARDVQVEHWNEFLESKAASCTTATLKQYATKIRKLERCVNHRYRNAAVNWSTGLKAPQSQKTPDGARVRTQQMEQADYDMIMDHVKRCGSSSRAIIAWELSNRLNLRVQGTAIITAGNVHLDWKGKWGFGQVDITEKGGRYRVIDIRTAEDREYLQGLIAGKQPEDLLVGIRASSINKALNRTMKQLGIKEKYPYTGEHSIRKLCSQTCWDHCRNNGMDTRQAKAYTNEQLGHMRTRDAELLKVYVRDMK